MDPVTRRLRITTLKAQIELCRITCTALEGEFDQPGLSPGKRIEIYHRLSTAFREMEDARSLLAVLELEEQVGYDEPESH